MQKIYTLDGLANPDDTSASLLEVFKNKDFFGLFPEMVEFGMAT